MREKRILIILTLGIFLLATFFRLYGLNWDQDQHLHPDERFLTMVVGATSWPQDLWEYLNASTSPLNPQNRGFGFFVYGTFPLFFTKWIAEFFNKGDYNQLTIVGRQLSALFDLGTVVLVFLIGKQILKSTNSQINKFSNKNLPKLLDYLKLDNWLIGLFAAFIYAAMVLPIQLSHFFAVDTYLTFFLTLSFYILIKLINCTLIENCKLKIVNYAILMGIAFGLALASKISALLFLPIIGLGLIYVFLRKRNLFLILNSCFLILISTYLTFRLTQPYVFATGNIFDITLNQKVLDNWKQLKSFDDPSGFFPPAIQWITTKPYLFPLKNLILWGLGLPLGIIALSAIGYGLWVMGYGLIKKKINSQLTTHNSQLILILLWIVLLFTYQGAQFAKALRYFYPIYPFLAIISGYFTYELFKKVKSKFKPRIFLLFVICYLLSVLIYPLSFLSIYSRPNSRIQASYWIYKNIPAGSNLSAEHWDDGLPMSLDNYIHEIYQHVEFPLYGADTREKWQEMDRKLKQVDYIVITSNRLYGSIMTVPNRYPITYKYYQALFDGSLGFAKVAEFTSRPNLLLPFIKLCLTPPFIRYGIAASKTQECPISGISFVDDYSDETFTVYDHPKVIIFKKVKEVDYYNLLNR